MNRKINKIKQVMKRKISSRHEFQYLKMIKKSPIEAQAILLESTHGRDFSGHVFYVVKYLAKEYTNFTIRVAVRQEKMDWVKRLFQRHGIQNVEFVEFLSKNYVKALATSKYLINDTSFWAFFNKRPEQVYINIWHGTPLKCLGKDNDLEGFGNVQKNFLAANYLVFSNEFTREKMVAAYNLKDIANTQVVVGPSPRNSVLMDPQVRDKVRSELGVTTKKVYMYMPTYRDSGTSTEKIEELLETMEKRLTDDEIFFVKLHPFDAEKISFDLSTMSKVRPFPSEFETYEFLTAVDTLVTDYSSIMYDFLCTSRDILLYTYDKEDYFSTRGVYEDIDEFPLPQVKSAEELLFALHNEKSNFATSISKEFKEKYISHDNLNGTIQLVDFLLRNQENVTIDVQNMRNDKDNIVFYAGGLWDNGISRAFLNNLDSIDLTEKNYILYLNDGAVKREHKYKLQELKIPYILSSGVTQYSFIDGVFGYLYLNTEFFGRKLFKSFIEKRVFDMYRFDFRRMFNSVDINQFIHYTGFERSYAAILSAIAGGDIRTTAFCHTDMFKEYRTKKNLNLKSLINMYDVIDQVVPVSEDIKKSLLKERPHLKNIIVMDNFLGYQKIRKDSEESIFSTLLGTPLQFGNVKAFSDTVLSEYGTISKLETNNKNQTLDYLKRHVFGEKGVFPNIDSHLEEFSEAINTRANRVMTLQEPLAFSSNEMPYMYGLSKMKLLDDLFNPEIKIFINIGRFSIEKGHERLIEAFATVNSRYPNTRLVMVAPHGPLKRETIKWIRERDLQEKVIILGGMENPYALLKMCDAFVFSSLYEGLGLVVFESLSVGTDVITVDIPATTQALTEGSVNQESPALIVDNDVESLTAGWLKYLSQDITFGSYNFEQSEAKSLAIWEEIVN